MCCLEAPDGREFILVSPKVDSIQAQAELGRVSRLRVGRRYELTLRQYDTLPSLEFFIRSVSNIWYDPHADTLNTTLDSSNLLWSDGTFYKPVYFSKDVVGPYVREASK
ncbi:MAG: hypothetical protein D6800_07525 [Candidatus Zixiibacteriota bacterium]|nr:MAG: hypothetical protein D6800_07525 [candidate division Zixibacteria bacterium]